MADGISENLPESVDWAITFLIISGGHIVAYLKSEALRKKKLVLANFIFLSLLPQVIVILIYF